MNSEQHFLTLSGPLMIRGLIRGSMCECCSEEKQRQGEEKEEEKLPNSGLVLIAEMQYNLFRNMQIQQSLCLVYQRDLLIQCLCV